MAAIEHANAAAVRGGLRGNARHRLVAQVGLVVVMITIVLSGFFYPTITSAEDF